MESASPRCSRQSSGGSEPCERFEPNPFKIAILLQKESCKHCGRPWTEHDGVISEDIFEGYLQALRKAADAWQREAADPREECCFYGDEPQRGPSGPSGPPDHDDFQMMSPTSLANLNAQTESAREVPGSAKVYGFIDFSECNVASHMPSESPSRQTSACDDLKAALQEAQDQVATLTRKCQVLEAKQMEGTLLQVRRLCQRLAQDPETAPEAADVVSTSDLEELHRSCALALARLRRPEEDVEAEEVKLQKTEDPVAPPVAPVRSPRFLPKRLQGVSVLTPLAPEIYRVENRLGAPTKGLAQRRSRSVSDVDPASVVLWGSTVTGRDEGDWIRCEAGVSLWAPWATPG